MYPQYLVEFEDKRDKRTYTYLVEIRNELRKTEAEKSIETIIIERLVLLFPHARFVNIVIKKVDTDPHFFKDTTFAVCSDNFGDNKE